jgi:sugar-specific transcriptional regulator TrmB
MNPYSGVVELFEAKGVIEKQGNRLKYVTMDGEEILEYRKNWNGDLLDKVMSDHITQEASVVNTSKEEDVDLPEEVLTEE